LIPKWISQQSSTYSKENDTSEIMIDYQEYDSNGVLENSYLAVGNLPSFRNIIEETHSSNIAMYYESTASPGGKTIKVELEWKQFADKEFDAVCALSEAIHEDPDAFTSETMIKIDGRPPFKICEHAKVEISNGATVDMKEAVVPVKNANTNREK
jgi:hypothetical protein